MDEESMQELIDKDREIAELKEYIAKQTKDTDKELLNRLHKIEELKNCTVSQSREIASLRNAVRFLAESYKTKTDDLSFHITEYKIKISCLETIINVLEGQ